MAHNNIAYLGRIEDEIIEESTLQTNTTIDRREKRLKHYHH